MLRSCAVAFAALAAGACRMDNPEFNQDLGYETEDEGGGGLDGSGSSSGSGSTSDANDEVGDDAADESGDESDGEIELDPPDGECGAPGRAGGTWHTVFRLDFEDEAIEEPTIGIGPAAVSDPPPERIETDDGFALEFEGSWKHLRFPQRSEDLETSDCNVDMRQGKLSFDFRRQYATEHDEEHHFFAFGGAENPGSFQLGRDELDNFVFRYVTADEETRGIEYPESSAWLPRDEWVKVQIEWIGASGDEGGYVRLQVGDIAVETEGEDLGEFTLPPSSPERGIYLGGWEEEDSWEANASFDNVSLAAWW